MQTNFLLIQHSERLFYNQQYTIMHFVTIFNEKIFFSIFSGFTLIEGLVILLSVFIGGNPVRVHIIQKQYIESELNTLVKWIKGEIQGLTIQICGPNWTKNIIIINFVPTYHNTWECRNVACISVIRNVKRSQVIKKKSISDNSKINSSQIDQQQT